MTSFEALIEDSSDVVFLLSATGEVLYASALSAKVFGYLPEELVGRNTFDLIHPKDSGHSRRALREVLAKPSGPRQLETRVRQSNGQWCRVESTISNLLDKPQVAAIVVNCWEIGAERAASEQKQQQTKELGSSNPDLEDFAEAVAHDLREPLRTISALTSLLVKDAQLDAHGELLGKLIIEGVASMAALFEGLHAFAIRGFDHAPQPLDLGHVVAEALRNVWHAINTSDAIVTVDPLPWVQGNEEHLVRVFQNLIVNAIKYRSEAPVKVHVAAERLGAGWIIKVKDNGIGIAREHHERIFRIGKRLHGPEIPGAGIGLPICKKIIEALGGIIWVEAEPGAGSTFCFTIAAAKEDGAVSSVHGDNRHLNRTLALARGLELSPRRANAQFTEVKLVGNGF